MWACECPHASSGARPRLGVIVSRKIAAKAVMRNLWKRKIREVFRQMQTEIKSGMTILVLPRRREKTPALQELKEDMEILMSRTGALKK